MSAISPSEAFTLTFYVPKAHTKTVLAAVHEAGAGAYEGGLYDQVAFITPGIDTFRPTNKASPHTGRAGQVEVVEEDRVEVRCVGRSVMRDAVAVLKKIAPL